MAIVTFKSKAAGEIYMFRETAERIFEVIGKPLGLRGVLTTEELALAAEKIRQAMAEEKELLKELRKKEDENFRTSRDLDMEKQPAIEQPVFFSQRAYPLLEMIEESQKEDTPVLWGV